MLITDMLLPFFTILATFVSAEIIERQAITSSTSASAPSGSTVLVITTSVFPAGVATGNSGITATVPLPCIDGCFQHTGPYAFCFLFDSYPDGRPYSKETQCSPLCNQTYYDGLSACLNCIVANGGERTITTSPRSPTSTISRSTSSATSSAGRSLQDYENANGPIDLSQANMWLKNVTDYCKPRGISFTGSGTVTAIPTTTGPYSTSWTSGQSILRPQWTGLTQYSPPLALYTRTVGTQFASSFSGQGGGGGASGAGGAAASQSSRAAGMSSAKGSSWLFGGALLAWAVL